MTAPPNGSHQLDASAIADAARLGMAPLVGGDDSGSSAFPSVAGRGRDRGRGRGSRGISNLPGG